MAIKTVAITMNEAELVVEENSQSDRVNKETSREAVDAIISAIIDSLGREERVTLVGFRTLEVMERKAREGVNPQTRARLDISAKNVVRFKAGKGLRKRIGR